MRVRVLFGMLSAVIGSPAMGSGFAISDKSVSALGQAFAGAAAQGADPSVLYNNPALLNALDGSQLAVGLNLISIHVDAAVADARQLFLDMKPYVSRLDVAVLVPDDDGTWRRGSFNPQALAYAASVVKLPYLVAAMHWCAQNGHPYEYLDVSVGPMIVDSDNVATGVVVDAITGAPNYGPAAPGAAFDASSWRAAE